ncbi:MAG TPA: DUF2273 domain-containing protein [Thermoanaerobacterales bacterium]|nr:DUF2273 domain-containing protein [Thermoanaerobacterales bacterium]
MDFLWVLWSMHRGKIIGGILGLIIATIIISLGFLKAVFVILCTVLGYYIGKLIDNKEDIRDILDKILPPGNR